MSVEAITWALSHDEIDNPPAKFVLMVLANYANAAGQSYPSIRTLSKKTGYSIRTVQRHLDWLEEQHLIRREERNRDNGSTTTNLFTVLMPERDLEQAVESDRVTPPPDTVTGEGVQELRGAPVTVTPPYTKAYPKASSSLSKKEKQSKVSDNRINHPAIVAIRSVCRRLPDKVLWDTLIKTVGDAPNVSRLELAFQQWRLKGYNPTNYSWVTEWYTGKEGSPCPRKERHLDYSDIIEMQSTQLDKCYSREWYEAGKQTFLDCYPDHRELCLKEIAQYEESAAFKLRQQQFDQPPVPQAIYQGT